MNPVRDIAAHLRAEKLRVDGALESFLPMPSGAAAPAGEAMRYAVLGPGKRLRPILALAAGDLLGTSDRISMTAGCAVEFVHAASLVMDDLPCMDNAMERRGRPATHVLHGEATAVLAGLGLVTEAFRLLAEASEFWPERGLAAVCELSRAAGLPGIIRGQCADLSLGGDPSSQPLDDTHGDKTGSLFVAALRIPALFGGASKAQLARLTACGQALGIAYQIADDLADAETGEDDARFTYPGEHGLEETRLRCDDLIRQALAYLDGFGPNADLLRGLISYVVARFE